MDSDARRTEAGNADVAMPAGNAAGRQEDGETPTGNVAPASAKNSAVLVGAVLLVGLVGIGSLWAFRQVQTAGADRLRTYAVLARANDLLSEVTDAETGSRGYVISGNESFLEPYLAVRERVSLTLEDLQRLAPNSKGRKHLDALTPLVDAKLANMSRVIGLRRAKDPEAAVALVSSGEGKSSMESIRAELGAFVRMEEGNLRENEAAFQSTMGNLFAMVSFASLLALLLAMTFAYSIHREAQQRLKRRSHLETRNLLSLQEEMNRRLQQTNDTLQESETSLAVTLHSIGDAVIATDARARVTRLNRVAEHLTGWTQAEAAGLPVDEILHVINKETRQLATLPVMRTLELGTAQELANHVVLIARDGRECDVADSCAPIRDGKGLVAGTVLIFRDVTAAYAAQQALRDSTALIQTILDTVGDGLMTIQAKGGVIETVNPAAERIFGYSAAELVGKPFSLLIPELDRDAQNGSLEYYSPSAEASAAGLGREVTGQRKDGSRFPLEIGLREMTLRGKRYFTGILRDVTLRQEVEADRKRLDRRVSDQQFYTRSLIESSVDALMTTDPSGIISDVNRQMEALTGRTRDELIGAPFKGCFTDPERAEAGVRLVLRDKKVTDYELTARSMDGRETVVSYNATTFYDRDRKLQGVFAAARDITERQRLDGIVKEKNEQLQGATLAAEKANLAKSEFLSSMSHELRTPLSAILGFAQLIESGSPPPNPAQKRGVDQILKAGWYLLDLINEILDLALIESGKLSLSSEPISVAEVMHECRAMTEPQARMRGITLTFPEFEAPIFVSADRTRLKQVLVNLLSNATKYNRARGTVSVACGVSAPGRVRVTVEDTGEGLASEKLVQLFQPFNRLGQEAHAEEGTGIGLVVCKRLVELMGGAIGATSTVGQGSVFWIELDLTTKPQPDAGHASPDSLAPKALPTTQVRTLLYVEDNPANLMLVEDLIARRLDIRLLSALDGLGGVEMARASLPDVILMDINLPGISGLQALRLLADDPATALIPVVALSANAMPRDIEKGLAAGFFRYLTKPIKVNEFMETIDQAFVASKARSLGNVRGREGQA